MHRQKWRHASNITMIIMIGPARQRRASLRFRTDDLDICPVDLIADKGERNAGKITATAGAANNNIRLLFINLLQLFFDFLPDDRLVQHDVI